MTRHILDSDHIHPAIRQTIASNNADIVLEVQQAIANNKVVVVGMKKTRYRKRPAKHWMRWALITVIWSTVAIYQNGIAAML